MKRHHLAALFLLIFGGLFVYLRLEDGEIERAIRMGIFFTLLGIFAFFSGRLQPRLRFLGVNLLLLIVLGVATYQDFIAGDIISVIIQGVLMSILIISAVALTLFQDKPFYKEKIAPWLEPTPHTGLVDSLVPLIVLLLLLFFGR